MVRLIDADRLREYYNVTDPAGTFAYCDSILTCIDNEPTVDAIPVEWIKALTSHSDMFTRGAAKWVLGCWKKEQEAQDG